MENQCLGLAEALGVQPLVKRVHPRAPWKFLPARLWWRPLRTCSSAADRFEPPWPELLISCGRRSVAVAVAVRRASAGRTFAVHIQDPYGQARHFDLVVVPRHDTLRGENVIVTRGALHRVTAERLAAAARRFAPALAHLPRPLVAVLVGGSNRRQRIDPVVIGDLAERLVAMARTQGAGLAVTASRRTGAENERVLRERLAAVASVVWDGTGENPYFGYLGLADAIVVTGDSVSMVSEACSTGKPVYVYDLEGGSKRLQRFHEGLRADGITRPFEGRLEHWTYPPLNETAQVAELVRARLRQRFASGLRTP
ncbi:MAG TPA: mitochondrial fission ELM1 family protein [Candidatus Competibacteraceae bacterium]|nr:mitochondrial fission ELM1 family protein [Candidatus Competibacteraceae bacterium]